MIEPARRPRAFAFRRIVVAADSSAHGQAALEAAVRLAARLEADLEGLFVEDVNLKRLAELPVGREVRFGLGGMARDAAAVAQDMRAEAGRIRRTLEEAAARAHVHVRFRIAEGHVEREVVAAGSAADLLVLGLTGRRIGPTMQPGGTALAAIRESRHSVLVLRPGIDITRRALVLYDGSAGAGTALDAAAHVAADQAEALTVVLRAADETEAAKLRRRAAQRLAKHNQGARFLAVSEPTLSGLCRAVTRAGASMLVISAADPLLEGNGHRRLLEDTACPVLLVR